MGKGLSGLPDPDPPGPTSQLCHSSFPCVSGSCAEGFHFIMSGSVDLSIPHWVLDPFISFMGLGPQDPLSTFACVSSGSITFASIRLHLQHPLEDRSGRLEGPYLHSESLNAQKFTIPLEVLGRCLAQLPDLQSYELRDTTCAQKHPCGIRLRLGFCLKSHPYWASPLPSSHRYPCLLPASSGSSSLTRGSCVSICF